MTGAPANSPRRPRAIRPVMVGVGIGMLATALAVMAGRSGFGSAIETRSYDLRVRARAASASSSSPVVIVEINESSVRALEPVVGRWPWPRLVHASAIDFLNRAGARVIAYDVLLLEHEGRSTSVINGRTITGDESDSALVNSVRRAGNVVLLADAVYQGLAAGEPADAPAPSGSTTQLGSGFRSRPLVTAPFAELAGAAVALGHNYLEKDPDSDAVRRVLPFVQVAERAVPSLATAATLQYLRAGASDVAIEKGMLTIRDVRMPLVSGGGVLLRMRRPVTGADGVTSTFPTYSFFDVVLSEDNALTGKPPVIPLTAFQDKLVFVGTTAAGLYDRYATPFASGAAGVELHGTFADNVTSRMFMRRASEFVDASTAGVMAAAVGIAATVLPVIVAVVFAIGAAGALWYWLAAEVGRGVWISAVVPLAATALALFGGVAWRYFVEDREKRQVRRLFGRYVSKDVADQLMTDPSLVRLGGQRREMSVLFSDIRGFTSASERSTPEAVVAQLNEYFGAMVAVLFRHQGTLDKFVGDMVMGLFGAPVPDPHHADHAVAAALDMCRTLEAMNAKWLQEGRPILNIGIGINTGEMIAGNIGSEAIMSYTVIGDAVNLGSRLESLNKEYGTHILISESTRAQLTIDAITRPLGAVTVKGRSQPVQVFEVREPHPSPTTESPA